MWSDNMLPPPWISGRRGVGKTLADRRSLDRQSAKAH
jgi:hypothetical protein